MRKKDLIKISLELENKIISVAYRDSGFVDWLIVHWKTKSNREVKNLLNEYRVTAEAVHKVHLEEAPSELSDSIKSNTSGEIQPNLFSRLASDLYYTVLGNKVIPAMVFSVLLLITAYFVLKSPDHTGKYSSAEIRLAQKQFKQTIGIIGDAFEKAEKSFNEDVLNNQINKNLNRGYFLVNNILIGG